MSSRGTSSYDGSVSTQGARVRLLEDGTLAQASPGGFGGKDFGAYPTSARHKRRSVGMVIAFIVVMLRVAKSKFTPAQATAAMAVSYYWHFVDAIWIGVFITLYLVQ